MHALFLSSVPSSPPDNVTAIVLSPTEILVTWDMVPPIDQNGIITLYEVLYVPLETFNETIQEITREVFGTEMSITLTDVQEFVNYTISVRAYTAVGEGPYSEEVMVTTLEDGMRMNIECYYSINVLFYSYSSCKSSKEHYSYCAVIYRNIGDLGQCPFCLPEWDHHYVRGALPTSRNLQ